MISTAHAWAPGRVNLIGEHTDYNQGLCLPVTIPVGTSVHARRRGDDLWQLRSSGQDDVWTGRAADAGPGSVSGWASYAAGVLWALTEAGHDLPGMDLEIDGDVPLGGGLSSSASLEAAVAVAACELAGLELDDALRRELVAICRRAESEVAGAPTGGLDQSAVLLVEAGAALLLDFADGSATQVPFPLADAGLRLIVIDTQVSHAHSTGGYGDRRAECDAAARLLGVASLRDVDEAMLVAAGDSPGDVPGGAGTDSVLLRRARHVVTENARVLRTVAAVAAADWTGVGDLFNASHASMRDDFEISCAELDLVVDTAVDTGALGARMTGGGFGGSAIALVPFERVEAVRLAVDTAFVRAGFRPPAHLDGTPSGPAHVVEPDLH